MSTTTSKQVSMSKRAEQLRRRDIYAAARKKYIECLDGSVTYQTLANELDVSKGFIGRIASREGWRYARMKYLETINKTNQILASNRIKPMGDYRGESVRGGVRDGQSSLDSGELTRSQMDEDIVHLAYNAVYQGGTVRDFIDARRLELAKEDRDGGDTTPKLVIENRSTDAAIGSLVAALTAIGSALEVPDRSNEPAVTVGDTK